MQDTLLTIFIGILTFAVLIQSLLFFGIYKSIRQLSERTDRLGRDLQNSVTAISSKLEASLTAIKDLGDGLKNVKEKLADTADIVHRRVVDLDDFLAEATKTARLEVYRVQDTIQSATRRAEETMDLVQDTILAPVREINAITRALRVGIDILFRGRRKLSRAAHDEGMFI